MPDDDAATAVAPRLVGRDEQARVLHHASGRPWLIASGWGQGLRTADAGPLRAALIGFCPVGAARLNDLAERACATGDTTALTRLPGAHYLAVSHRGTATSYGDVTGLNRLFTARIDGNTVTANTAGLLARLTGAGVDEQWVAMRLLAPHMPGPVQWSRSPYQGVHPVPPGHRVAVSSAGTSVSRYWSPPAARLSLHEGAEQLRQALTVAVEGRVADVAHASVQLSGGLDSQALAALATRSRPDTLLLTVGSSTPDNADERWARHTADQLDGAVHEVIDPARYPRIFEDLTAAQFTLDEPASFAASAARLRHTLRKLTEHGTGAHLNGQGGDETLTAPLSYLATTARRRPARAWRQLRGHAALHRYRTLALARAVLPGSYRQWITRAARGLTAPASAVHDLAGWEAPPRLPPWTTPHTAARLQQIVLDAANTAMPVTADITTHGTLMRIHSVARRAGTYRDAMAQAGVAVHFPFLDRSVIEAALTTRPEERTDPWAPKPLLAAAVAPLAPAGLLTRRDKGHYNAEIHDGLAAHRGELAALFDGSALAKAGLIDDRVVRAALDQAVTSRTPLAFFTETVALELWLRSIR
ncbi:asparagine synthase-related protein [Streptomyces ipomoeae]|uniref:asparagine synthase-related protein n=1 Tax=Streptomyces ipomoeae TaxID=103232 RepID=UPI0029BA00D4|nr:asparagine synthase-related protein [Streptomyces ipomoeae]MDX2819936.1 asparagine synthase-related protein [Streptomyces ipomoeae]MDX2872618.1 asparagine synthase-related protein [Streptomyces ipomoeae]